MSFKNLRYLNSLEQNWKWKLRRALLHLECFCNITYIFFLPFPTLILSVFFHLTSHTLHILWFCIHSLFSSLNKFLLFSSLILSFPLSLVYTVLLAVLPFTKFCFFFLYLFTSAIFVLYNAHCVRGFFFFWMQHFLSLSFFILPRWKHKWLGPDKGT